LLKEKADHQAAVTQSKQKARPEVSKVIILTIGGKIKNQSFANQTQRRLISGRWLDDARGARFSLDQPLSIFLDDDLEYRQPPPGWAQLQTVAEVQQALLSGNVVELSLDNDLGLAPVAEPGAGYQIIDFLEEQQAVYQRFLWPQRGITVHSANPEARRRICQALETLPRRHPGLQSVEQPGQLGTKRKFLVTAAE
jgi:hypothetical protein